MVKEADVLARGYFPSEIPPVFTSAGFAACASDLKAPLPKEGWDRPNDRQSSSARNPSPQARHSEPFLTKIADEDCKRELD